jgi:hypothetical protein
MHCNGLEINKNLQTIITAAILNGKGLIKAHRKVLDALYIYRYYSLVRLNLQNPQNGLDLLLHRLTETEWLQLHLHEICTRIGIRIKLKLQEEERKGNGFTPHLNKNGSSLLPLLSFPIFSSFAQTATQGRN